MFTKKGTCDSGVRRRTQRAALDWLQRGEARSPVGRAGYAMMGEGRGAVDCARTRLEGPGCAPPPPSGT